MGWTAKFYSWVSQIALPNSISLFLAGGGNWGASIKLACRKHTDVSKHVFPKVEDAADHAVKHARRFEAEYHRQRREADEKARRTAWLQTKEL